MKDFDTITGKLTFPKELTTVYTDFVTNLKDKLEEDALLPKYKGQVNWRKSLSHTEMDGTATLCEDGTFKPVDDHVVTFSGVPYPKIMYYVDKKLSALGNGGYGDDSKTGYIYGSRVANHGGVYGYFWKTGMRQRKLICVELHKPRTNTLWGAYDLGGNSNGGARRAKFEEGIAKILDSYENGRDVLNTEVFGEFYMSVCTNSRAYMHLSDMRNYNGSRWG